MRLHEYVDAMTFESQSLRPSWTAAEPREEKGKKKMATTFARPQSTLYLSWRGGSDFALTAALHLLPPRLGF